MQTQCVLNFEASTKTNRTSDDSQTTTPRVELTHQKDPFFEDSCEIPGFESQSKIQYSRLIFRSIYMKDLKLLHNILGNQERCLANVYNLRKSLHNPITTLEYAILLENKVACECLLDFYLNRTTPTVTNTTTKVSKSLDDEINLEDEDETVDACLNIESLVRYCYEINCSHEIIDLLVRKLSIDKAILAKNLISAFIFGNMELAAHVLATYTQNSDANHSYMFSKLHTNIILNKSEDFDTNVSIVSLCKQKAFLNDSITPIHLACIQHNDIKYLKSMLNLMQIDVSMDIGDSQQRKPIHYASACEVPLSLEFLLTRCNSFAKQYDLDANSNTPLHYACLSGRAYNIEILLANAQSKYSKSDLNTDELGFYSKYGTGGINFPNKFGKLFIF
jgi:hypothetical protein